MADVFNRQTDRFGGAFAADQAKVTFPALIGNNGANAGLLMQGMRASYSQQITRLYEVGSPNFYYVGGRTAGQASMDRVIGPRKIQQAFYLTYGDICNALTNSLHFSVDTGCAASEGSRAAFTCHFVVVQTISIGFNAQDMLIHENLGMIFSSFLYS